MSCLIEKAQVKKVELDEKQQKERINFEKTRKSFIEVLNKKEEDTRRRRLTSMINIQKNNIKKKEDEIKDISKLDEEERHIVFEKEKLYEEEKRLRKELEVKQIEERMKFEEERNIFIEKLTSQFKEDYEILRNEMFQFCMENQKNVSDRKQRELDYEKDMFELEKQRLEDELKKTSC